MWPLGVGAGLGFGGPGGFGGFPGRALRELAGWGQKYKFYWEEVNAYCTDREETRASGVLNGGTEESGRAEVG